MSGGSGSEPPLVSALRAGDVDELESLLWAGSDPDVRDGRGVPVLCLAIEEFAGPAAHALVRHGADPDRCGPDGVPPLRKAVDSGSPTLVEAVLHDAPHWRQRESELLEMRDLARRRHTTGAEAELRRRAGAQGTVVRTRVQEDEFTGIEEFSLGGLTVRDGHAAILTHVEATLGILTFVARPAPVGLLAAVNPCAPAGATMALLHAQAPRGGVPRSGIKGPGCLVVPWPSGRWRWRWSRWE